MTKLVKTYQTSYKKAFIYSEDGKKYFVVSFNDMGHSFVSNFENYELAEQFAEGWTQ